MTTDATAAPLARYQRFRDRLAGRPADTTLRTDVSASLRPALQHWLTLATQSDPDTPRRVALRLEIEPVVTAPNQHSYLDALRRVGEQHSGPDLLDVVHAMLEVHRGPSWVTDVQNREVGENYLRLVVELRDDLEDAGSAFTVADNNRALVERVDPTVVAAVEQTIDAAPPTAGGLLRDAWRQVYGLHPDSTTGYRDAVRAVEEVACPLVLPNDGAATLGKVIGNLRQGAHLWAFVLVDRAGADTVDPLVGMLDRLWTGQVSRHGGGQKSRDQTTAEAQAAVHLAATVVQLLGAGALTRRATA